MELFNDYQSQFIQQLNDTNELLKQLGNSEILSFEDISQQIKENIQEIQDLYEKMELELKKIDDFSVKKNLNNKLQIFKIDKQQVNQQYKYKLQEKDTSELKNNEKQKRKVFEQLEQQSLSIDNCKIQIQDNLDRQENIRQILNSDTELMKKSLFNLQHIQMNLQIGYSQIKRKLKNIRSKKITQIGVIVFVVLIFVILFAIKISSIDGSIDIKDNKGIYQISKQQFNNDQQLDNISQKPELFQKQDQDEQGIGNLIQVGRQIEKIEAQKDLHRINEAPISNNNIRTIKQNEQEQKS